MVVFRYLASMTLKQGMLGNTMSMELMLAMKFLRMIRTSTEIPTQDICSQMPIQSITTGLTTPTRILLMEPAITGLTKTLPSKATSIH